MSRVPRTKQGKITYFQNLIDPLTANAVAVGTTPAAVSALDTLVGAAADAFAAKVAAESTFKAKVEASDQAIDAMATAGADIIASVDTKARTAGAVVYTLSQIAPPANPSPRPAPGQPTDFKAKLLVGGDVDLAWKCPQTAGAAGTIYQVYRRQTPTAAWDFLGTTGERKYIDATIPAGAGFVMYKVRGVRSTVAGQWGEFNVTFGAGAGEGAVTAVTGPKMAA